MSLPPLNAVRTFEAAARHLNFTKAANELCVTPGAVSRAITQLEDRLQVPLFKHDKRRLQLTAAGQSYWFQVSQALGNLSAATDELQQYRGDGGVLVVGVLPTLGERWLIPKLSNFYHHHPNISIELKTLPSDFSKSFTELDLEEYGVDVALYLGQSDWVGVSCDRLFKERMLPVSSPSQATLLKSLLDNDSDAKQHLLLHSTRPQVWHYWFEQHNDYLNQMMWKARFEHYFMVIEAAVNGLGLALLPEKLVETELQQGRLIALLDAPLEQPQYYCLLHHSVRSNEEKIKLFREWLIAQQ
jgi:DNA-binding transcriptional LysR family regulator